MKLSLIFGALLMAVPVSVTSCFALSKPMVEKREGIYAQADKLCQAQKILEAIALYSSSISASPDLPGLRTRRAYLVSGRPDADLESLKSDALADIELGKKQNDDAKSIAASYGVLATYYQKKEQWQKMSDAASEAIKLYPRNCGAYSMRAFADHSRGELAAMRADAAQMEQFSNLSSFPDNFVLATTYHNLEMFPKALVFEAKAISLAPNPALKRTLEMIRLNSLMQMNSFDAAIAQVNTMLSVDPKNAELLSCKGQILTNRGQDDAALACYTAALKQDASRASTFKLRGDLYLRILEEDRALADYTQALKLDKNDWHSLGARARLYEQAKKYRLAIDDASQSIKIGPQIPKRVASLLELRGASKLELHMYQDSLSDLQSAEKVYPDSERIKSMITLARKRGAK